VRRGTSPESREARASGDKDGLREAVLGFIRQCGLRGSTADELAAGLDLIANSVAPRVTELRQRGLVTALIDAAGNPVRRRTRQGCGAGVVVAVEFCRQQNCQEVNTSLFENLAPERRYPD
jgi:hypothetical protein